MSFLLLALLDFDQDSASGAALLFFGASLQQAVTTMLIEGRYAQKMKEHPDSSSDLVTFVWAVYMLGSLVASLCIGTLADHVNRRAIFLVALPVLLQIIIPACFGYLDETPSPSISCIAYLVDAKSKFLLNPKIFVLAIAMAVGCLSMTAVNLTAEADLSKLLYAVSTSRSALPALLLLD